MGSPAGLSSGPHTACPGTLTWDYTVGGDGTHGDGSQHRLQRHRLSSQKTGHLGGHTQPHHRGAAKQSGTWAPGHSGLPRSPTQPPKLSSCRAPRNTQLRTLPGMKGRPCLGAHLPWRMGRTPSGCLPTVGYKGDPVWVPALGAGCRTSRAVLGGSASSSQHSSEVATPQAGGSLPPKDQKEQPQES